MPCEANLYELLDVTELCHWARLEDGWQYTVNQLFQVVVEDLMLLGWVQLGQRELAQCLEDEAILLPLIAIAIIVHVIGALRPNGDLLLLA